MKRAHLAQLLLFLRTVAASAAKHSELIIDLRECHRIDPAACVMLEAELERAEEMYGTRARLLLPRFNQPRFALAIMGVRGQSIPLTGVEEGVALRRVSQIASGRKGDPSPSERTFEVAQLAEEYDPALANRIHGALNEAAENVMTWAYDRPLEEPAHPGERWWAAGFLKPGVDTSFIAYDRGVGIPAKAPKVLGDRLDRTLLAVFKGKAPSLEPLTDDEVLWLTIRHKRSVSGKEERGKGLARMISLIDATENGFIRIFSGGATYLYHRQPGSPVAKETCVPLSLAFPGTMIIWSISHAPDPDADA